MATQTLGHSASWEHQNFVLILERLDCFEFIHVGLAHRSISSYYCAVFLGATTRQETWSGSTSRCLPLLTPPLHKATLDSRVSAVGPAPSATRPRPPRPRTRPFTRWHAAQRTRLQRRSSPNSYGTTLSALTRHTKASKRRTRETTRTSCWKYVQLFCRKFTVTVFKIGVSSVFSFCFFLYYFVLSQFWLKNHF